MKTVSRTYCVLILSVCLVGCGGDSSYTSPKTTFDTMIKAAAAEDKNAVMACFTEETRKDLEELEKLASGAQGAPKQVKFIDQFKGAEPVYGEEQIDGDKATLEVTIKGKKETVQFVKKDGTWKISFPELKMVLEMMKGGMGDMMKSMGEGMGKAMEDLGKSMGEAIEEGTKEAGDN